MRTIRIGEAGEDRSLVVIRGRLGSSPFMLAGCRMRTWSPSRGCGRSLGDGSSGRHARPARESWPHEDRDLPEDRRVTDLLW